MDNVAALEGFDRHLAVFKFKHLVNFGFAGVVVCEFKFFAGVVGLPFAPGVGGFAFAGNDIDGVERGFEVFVGLQLNVKLELSGHVVAVEFDVDRLPLAGDFFFERFFVFFAGGERQGSEEEYREIEN